MGGWRDGEMGRWRDGEMVGDREIFVMVEDGTFFYTELNGFDIKWELSGDIPAFYVCIEWK